MIDIIAYRSRFSVYRRLHEHYVRSYRDRYSLLVAAFRSWSKYYHTY